MLTLLLCLQASLAPKPVVVGPLKNEPPSTWVAEKPANLLRSYQFRLPAANDAQKPAELVVYPESTPKFAAKFAEWQETVTPTVGVAPDKAVVVSLTPLADGAVAHRLDCTGTWKYRERPRDPTSKTEVREDYRVIWLVVVHSDGATHLRFSGPKAVVAEHLPAFERWLKGLK